MKTLHVLPLVPLLATPILTQSCPDYSLYSQQRHPPFSSGRYQLSYQRPDPACRTFNSSSVESLLTKMESVISDPDLYRLFQNAYPNTLDTAIKWRGVAANNSAEELTFIITGDINAMWLRDSANQMQSYLPLLKPDAGRDGIASLYRGVINLQARYLLTSPYCNSFQPPTESGIPPATNDAAAGDSVTPPYSPDSVFECKYELDSLAAFLEVSTNYYTATADVSFFGEFQWISAIQAVLNVAKAMQTPTYGADGRVLDSPYSFTRQTTRSTETFSNDGLGNPVANGTGLIRSGFRPSDDSTIFQLFIPANMMFCSYLESTGEIMRKLGDKAPVGLAEEMKTFAQSLRTAIQTYGVIPLAPTPGGGGREIETIYAYEVDGFGSATVMDDANIPSLLSAPFFGYLTRADPIYQRTRARILDSDSVNGNPYFMRGPVMNAVGGPHAGPGMAWPMASIVRILTSDDDREITAVLREVLGSTDGLGLIHESVNSFDAGRWTRQW
jgi:meiotically up-regulated gene 157 (Mug157) protein